MNRSKMKPIASAYQKTFKVIAKHTMLFDKTQPHVQNSSVPGSVV